MVEKRSETRINVTLDVAYQLQGEMPIKFITTIKDASFHGMRILTDDVLPEGARIKIEIYVPDHSGTTPVNAIGEVRWSRRTEDQSFETGVQLSGILKNGEERWLHYINDHIIR